MLYSYFKLLIRNVVRRSLYEGINITGLTIGITSAALVALFCWHEFNYDRFHPAHRSIVRVSSRQNDTWFAPLSAPYANALVSASVGKVVRVRRYPNTYLHHNGEKFYEEKILVTDTESPFFEFFNFPAIEGNLEKALKEPYSIVLTQSLATKIFGSRNALGESVMFDTLQLKVTAVLYDLPSNTHFNFNVLMTFDKAMERASGFYTYCMLNNKTDYASIQQILASVPVSTASFDFQKDCKLLPLADIHFDGNMTYEMKSPGSKMYLLIFILMGAVVLVLSCSNFISLSVVVYTNRSKEIAIRKVVGANRSTVFWQFLFESVFLSLLCIPLILVLSEIVLPFINSITGLHIQNLFIQSFNGFALLVLTIILIGALSGLYPAVLLPKVSSMMLLNRGISKGMKSVRIRAGLVGFQITIMVIMLSFSWGVHNQLSYILNKDLGIEQSGIIKLKGAWKVDTTQYRILKSQLLQNPTVLSVSQGLVPGDEDYGFAFKIKGTEEVHSDLISFSTDQDYLKTLGVELLTSEFSSSDDMPGKIVLINETLAKHLPAADPIGQEIILNPGTTHERTRVVNGVFKDFHFFSLHQPLVPMLLTFNTINPNINQNILVKVHSTDLSQSIEQVAKIANEIIPDIPFTSEFLEEDLIQQYENEKRLSFFAYTLLFITITLAVIGLIGLISYTTRMRTKEIGIRKVLGSSLMNVLTLLGMPYIRMALIAFLIGSVGSAYLLTQWLQSFSYKTTISWTLFAYTLVGLLAVLIVTVGLQAIKAALANPVESLRSE